MKDFKQGAQTGAGLREHGERMGFKYGGSVKNTSKEFVMKTEKQDTMDTGTQPARKGRNQAEIEAGGTKKMLPGYKKGGKIKDKMGAGYTKSEKEMYEKRKSKKGDYDDPADRRADSKSKMPKTVKAKGGKAKYMEGGLAAATRPQTMAMRGGKMSRKAHNSTPMYGK